MFNFFRSKKVIPPVPQAMAPIAPKPQPALKPQPAQAAITVNKPSKSLQHDGGLVSALTQEHAELLRLFTDIADVAEQKKWGLVEGKLKFFKDNLVDHLVKEGIKLYAYGTSACKNDPALLSTFNTFKVEMSGIGSVVFNFIDKWSKPDALKDEQGQHQFTTELGGIGEALVARIKREEKTLYPLYDSLRDLNESNA